jgi:7,8-dihydro-6-hydroxymethylpterin-pyrophosphokinase
MHERRFVLAPLAEIAPDWIVPTKHKSVRELLDAIP